MTPLDEEAERKFKQAVVLGVSYKNAALYAGLDPRDIAARLEDRDFKRRCEQWRAEAVVFHAARTRLATASKEEKRFSEDFLRRYDWGGEAR